MILIDIVIIAALGFTGYYIYQEYGDRIREFFGVEQHVAIFIDNLGVRVTIADEPEERRQGLSGVAEIGDLEGKLFVFDQMGQHSIWMKDMEFPIDLIFIDNNLRVVDTIENVRPDSYPQTFTSDKPARFVLEVNAFFVNSFQVEEGQKVSIPPRHLPDDLQ